MGRRWRRDAGGSRGTRPSIPADTHSLCSRSSSLLMLMFLGRAASKQVKPPCYHHMSQPCSVPTHSPTPARSEMPKPCHPGNQMEPGVARGDRGCKGGVMDGH